MQYRPFGKLGIETSILGFGAMRLPSHEDGTVNLDAAVPILRRGIDLGINYIDTAHVYINGTSEVAVGQAIKGYDRSKLYLATKIPVHSQGDSDAWRGKLEVSLKRFDTSYIDFILFHGLGWAEYEQVLLKKGSALEQARQAQSEGLVRHICFSSHDETENVIRLIDTGEFAALLLQYNYLDRHNEPAFARAAERGMGTVVMGPLAGGRLATPEGVVEDREGALEMRTPDVALRFVWNNPHICVALSGMSTIPMVEENCVTAARLGALDDQEHARVIELVEKTQQLADLYCTGCGYCMPCPNDVNIPENFRYMNWYRVWGLEKEAREAYAKLTMQGNWMPYGFVKGEKASACLECGECLAKCPQNIDIIGQLREVADILG